MIPVAVAPESYCLRGCSHPERYKGWVPDRHLIPCRCFCCDRWSYALGAVFLEDGETLPDEGAFPCRRDGSFKASVRS